MPSPPLHVRKLTSGDTQALSLLFETLLRDSTAARFRPHPMDAATAAKLATYSKKDIYAGVWLEDRLVGYGMLRGFDAGYEIPTIGIYVTSLYRGRGVARSCLQYLHDQARKARATWVMLRVYPDNHAAVRLYENLGYEFDGTVDSHGEKVGLLML